MKMWWHGVRDISISSSEIVSLLGGILVVASTLLPWVSATVLGVKVSVLGIDTPDGKIIFVLGIISLGVLFIPRYTIRSLLATSLGLIIFL